MTWRNPTPVAVVLVPIDGQILLVRRNIPPAVGKLALPGGYVDFAETWQEACARELREETGVVIPPDDVTLLDLHSAPQQGLLILFGLARPLRQKDIGPWADNDEVSEIVLTPRPIELAFPTHQLVLDRYFELRSCP